MSSTGSVPSTGNEALSETARVERTLAITGLVTSTRREVTASGAVDSGCLWWRALAVAGVRVVQKFRMWRVRKEAIYNTASHQQL